MREELSLKAAKVPAINRTGWGGRKLRKKQRKKKRKVEAQKAEQGNNGRKRKGNRGRKAIGGKDIWRNNGKNGTWG